MNKISALAVSAGFVLALPVAAIAQTSVETPPAGVDVQTGVDAQVGTGAEGEVGVGLSHSEGDVLTAIEGSASADLAMITEETEINIVAISTVTGGDADEMSLAEAQTTYESEISTLRSNISGNATLNAALEAEGYSSDDVVAVWSEADGSVTVFVDA